MTDLVESLSAQAEGIALSWAQEYGGLLAGAAADVDAFFKQTAHIATEAAIEGDEDALQMLKLAGYSLVSVHRLRLDRKNRATVQRGIRLLVGVVQVLVSASVGGLASAAGAAVREATGGSVQGNPVQ